MELYSATHCCRCNSKPCISDETACSTCSASGAATACAVTTPILWGCPAYKTVHTYCFSYLTAAEPLAVLVIAGCLPVMQSFACLPKKQVITDLLLWQDELKLAGRPARAKRTSPNRPCSRRALTHSQRRGRATQHATESTSAHLPSASTCGGATAVLACGLHSPVQLLR